MDKDHKVIVGLTQLQLGGYDPYVHGQLVRHGNARVLVQTCLVGISLLYHVNDEIMCEVLDICNLSYT